MTNMTINSPKYYYILKYHAYISKPFHSTISSNLGKAHADPLGLINNNLRIDSYSSSLKHFLFLNQSTIRIRGVK